MPKKSKQKKKQTPFTIAETFVGCGGSHLGFKKFNFEPVFLNDVWDKALDTLKYNNPDDVDKVVLGDIRELCEQDLCKKYKIAKGKLDVLMGGVVCKGFSLAGVRNPFDERSYLYISQLKLVEQLRPKISVIENVPAMEKMRILMKPGIAPMSGIGEDGIDIDVKMDEEIVKLCNELNTISELLKINRGKTIAVKKRINMGGNTEDLIEMEGLRETKNQLKKNRDALDSRLSNYKYSVVEDICKRYNQLGYRVFKNKLKCSNYGGYTNRIRLFIVAIRNDVVGDWEWPTITNDDSDDELPNLRTVRDAFDLLDYDGVNNPELDPDNKPMTHRPSTVEKFKKITSQSTGGFSSRGTSKRLAWDKPAPTLVPGHSSFSLHPEEHRSISVREGGIISGFPKNFVFKGNHTDRCMQIGNAIPVELGIAIASSVDKFLRKAS